ncbi:MAG TPA: SufE family protein [Opitutaceae bacterium]|nr:SufE family protein [Opitutaceae bacterium]
MSLEQKRAELVETIGLLPDGEERLAYLLSRGRSFPPLESRFKTDERLLPGCVSQLWLVPEYRDGRCYFGMDADALIAKGIAAVVCAFYNGETPADIIAMEPDFLREVGITQVLSPNRANGLASLRQRIKAFAQHCLAQA